MHVYVHVYVNSLVGIVDFHHFICCVLFNLLMELKISRGLRAYKNVKLLQYMEDPHMQTQDFYDYGM